MSGLAGALAFLAVAIRVLFPGGYMLADTDGSGRLAIVICTGDGMKTLLVSPDGKVGDHGDGSAPHSAHDGGLCPYAGAAAPGVAPDEPVIFPEQAEASLALSRARDSEITWVDRSGTRPPPTGPPARA